MTSFSLENGLRHPKNQQIFRGPRTPYSLVFSERFATV